MADSIDDTSFVGSLSGLLDAWRRAIELGLNVSCPAHVIAYDPDTQLADVELGRLPVRYDGEDEVVQPKVVIPGIRVRFLGAGSSYVTVPVVPGTTGHVVFSDRCIVLWHKRGEPTDPVNGRTHDLADAFFEPGLRHNANTLPTTDSVATVVEGTTVKIGRSATEALLKGTTISTKAAAAKVVLGLTPPAAGDLVTVTALANANNVALRVVLDALISDISTKGFTE